MTLSIFTPVRYSIALLISVLLLAGCSSSSDSDSQFPQAPAEVISVDGDGVAADDGSSTSGSTSVTANEIDNATAGETTSGGLEDGTVGDTATVGDTTGIDSEVSTDSTDTTDESTTAGNPDPIVELESESPAALLTRVDFDITVPVYVSDSLQVQLSWGDSEFSAGWVVDETWRASGEFPSDTENVLSVSFLDRNGAVVLSSYEASFRTGTSPTETVSIFADQFESSQLDDDLDGVSNLEESIAGTDPLSAPDPSTQNLVRVDFGISVPAIMSDALQVQFEWGDEEIEASWTGDEFWVAFADLPADTEEPLSVTFFDRNGDLTLGNYVTTYETANNGAEYFQIESRQINTHRFDNDVDGVSNYREILVETDPLVSDSSVPVTFASISQRFSWNRCIDCHSRWQNNDDLHGTLLGQMSRDDQNYVIPFEPEESFLVEKLEGSMLRFGGAEMAELVRAWITLGAEDN